MNALQFDVQSHVLAALVLAGTDGKRAFEILEAEAGYLSDTKPGLSATLRTVARLARRHMKRMEGDIATAGAGRLGS